MTHELTKQDVDTLIDAVEAWEKSTHMDGLMGDMLTAVVFRGDDAALVKMKRERELENQKREAKRKTMRERGVLLRAKLIQLRDSMDADALLTDSQTPIPAGSAGPAERIRKGDRRNVVVSDLTAASAVRGTWLSDSEIAKPSSGHESRGVSRHLRGLADRSTKVVRQPGETGTLENVSGGCTKHHGRPGATLQGCPAFD